MNVRDAILTYALNALWQIPLISGAAALSTRVLRGTGARVEHRVRVLALLLSAVLPTFPGLLPVPLLMPSSNGASSLSTVSFAIVQTNSVAGHALLALPVPVLNVLCAAYLICVSVLAIRFVSSMVRLRRLSRSAKDLTLAPEAMNRWERICAAQGLTGTRLVESVHVTFPVTFGVGIPVLLLPAGFTEEVGWREIETALAHEAAHVERRDFAKHLLYTLASLPIAWHPITYLLRARVAETREMVCDAQAARVLGSPERYATSLLRLAELLPQLPSAVNLNAIGIFDANTLERRVITMIGQTKQLNRRRRIGSMLAAGFLGLATCGSAMALHIKVDSTRPARESANEQAPVTQGLLAYKVNPVYPAEARANKDTLDGAVLLEVEVNAVGKPTSVRVLKGLREDYDQSATDAVTEWRFHPAMKNGKAVPVEMKITISYQIQP